MQHRTPPSLLLLLVAAITITTTFTGCHQSAIDNDRGAMSPSLPSDAEPDGDGLVHSSSVTTCAGYSSPGNPFSCCSNGNCTWWGWKMARDTWGDNFPARRSARYWVDEIWNDCRYSVSKSASRQTLAVNTTASVGGVRYGHVAWVESVNYVSNPPQVYVSEMGCDSWQGVRRKWYPASYFDGGYISRVSCRYAAGPGGQN